MENLNYMMFSLFSAASSKLTHDSYMKVKKMMIKHHLVLNPLENIDKNTKTVKTVRILQLDDPVFHISSEKVRFAVI